ncbi:MAG TPA: glycosyltransferase family A protein [Bryobacteraceae bacterium]|nr:glycosyltransferase family A protein [Bryobacteraceae bacterium]
MDGLVSVVIPTHNGQRHIAATLDSVLAQRHRPLEILVVDDGSSDSTAEIVRGYAQEVRLIEQERRGHPAARNTGIRAAAGEYLAFLDHDDLWSPDKLELQMACFERDPALDLVFGHILNFFSPEMPPEERRRMAVPLRPLPGLLQGAMLARRRSFDRVGLFSEARPVGDFLDWYGRAMLAGMNIAMLPETVVYRRIHASNFQRLNKNQHRLYLRAVKDLLDRRRGVVGS